MLKIESWVGFLTAFSALAVVLGYIFELGFAAAFDRRILEFLTVEDYISTAAVYVFAIVATTFGTTLVLSDNLALPTRIRAIVRYYFIDEREFSSVQKGQGKRIGNYIWIIAGAISIFLAVVGVADNKWTILSDFWKEAAKVLLPLALFSIGVGAAVRYLTTLDDVGERRIGGISAAILLTSVAMFLYGGYEADAIKSLKNNTVRIVQKDGHELDGVLIGKFSTGVAISYIGDRSVYFVPNDEIAQVILLPIGPSNQ